MSASFEEFDIRFKYVIYETENETHLTISVYVEDEEVISGAEDIETAIESFDYWMKLQDRG